MDKEQVLQLLNQEKLAHVIHAWMQLDPQTQHALADFTNNYIFLFLRMENETYVQAAQRLVLRTKELGMKEPNAYTSLF